LIVGPKIESAGKMGFRYHAKESPKANSEWIFEERESSLAATNMLLVRVVVGKVEHGNRLIQILLDIAVLRVSHRRVL